MATAASKITGRSTQLKYAAAGKCQRCGKKAPVSESLCGNCLREHNSATKTTKDTLIAAGRCAWCGKRNKSGFRLCDHCREKYNAGRRERRIANA